MNEIKNLLISAINDQDARVIQRLLNDAVETKAITSATAKELSYKADIMYRGNRVQRNAAMASALKLVG